jgi:hypothetical protein
MAAHQAAEELAIVKQLLIVSRHRRQLYEEIKRAFAGHENVDVILDRRVFERRRSKDAPGVDRRSRSRRPSPPSTSSSAPSAGGSCLVLVGPMEPGLPGAIEAKRKVTSTHGDGVGCT